MSAMEIELLALKIHGLLSIKTNSTLLSFIIAILSRRY